VAYFVALLIVLFFLAPMPELADEDMNFQEGQIGGSDPGPLREQYNLFIAILSQFCYVSKPFPAFWVLLIEV
jgi:FHS family L-fucose permease-like MFS transporter